MSKILPWLLGAVGGAVIALLSVLILEFTSTDDPEYGLVTVSWGSTSNGEGPWIYQVQVISDDIDEDGVLEISAKACIGSSDYFHDFGDIGTAGSRKEAIEKFGKVTWTADRVTIGGSEGEKAGVDRKTLEKHR